MKKMKYFILYLTSIIFSINAFAETTIYDEIFKTLNENNKFVKLANLEHLSEMHDFKAKNLQWVPDISLNTYTSVFGKFSALNEHEWYIAPKLVINQKLLAGSNLKIYMDNKLSILKEDTIKFDHALSTGAELVIPMYLFAPSVLPAAFKNDFYYQENGKKFSVQKLQKEVSTNISNAILIIGKYVIEKKRLELNEILKANLEELNTSNRILWENGKISTIEFHEKLLSYEKNIKDLEIQKLNYEILKNTYKSIGLNENCIPEDLRKWIEELEKLLENIEITSILELEIEKNRIESQWHREIDKTVLQLPKFFISCEFKNIEPVVGPYNKNFLGSLKDTFTSDYTWEVTMGVNLSFNIFDELYQTNKNFIREKEKYLLQKQIINDTYTEKLAEVQKTIYVMDTNIARKAENNKLLKEHLRKSEVLAQQGSITNIDYEIEKIYYEMDVLNYLEERLNRISYLIFYK